MIAVKNHANNFHFVNARFIGNEKARIALDGL
jgi:hypothetical protein